MTLSITWTYSDARDGSRSATLASASTRYVRAIRSHSGFDARMRWISGVEASLMLHAANCRSISGRARAETRWSGGLSSVAEGL
jgi:hypothetical protein